MKPTPPKEVPDAKWMDIRADHFLATGAQAQDTPSILHQLFSII